MPATTAYAIETILNFIIKQTKNNDVILNDFPLNSIVHHNFHFNLEERESGERNKGRQILLWQQTPRSGRITN